jgi:hypothetical protein
MRASMTTAATGAVGVVVLAMAAPTAPAAERNPAPSAVIQCGADGDSGLAVATDQATGCATALQVAASHTQDWYSGGEGAKTVHAAGSVWSCGKRSGSPNPYQQCVDTGDRGRWATPRS